MNDLFEAGMIIGLGMSAGMEKEAGGKVGGLLRSAKNLAKEIKATRMEGRFGKQSAKEAEKLLLGAKGRTMGETKELLAAFERKDMMRRHALKAVDPSQSLSRPASPAPYRSTNPVVRARVEARRRPRTGLI